MSHLEKFDTVIHDIFEPAAIGCNAIFHELPFMPNFAAESCVVDKGKRGFL